eukprot:UN01299
MAEAEETDALKNDVEVQAIQPQQETDSPPQLQHSFSKRATIYIAQYQEKATKEQVACIATFSLLLASAPAIAAVIIASGYNKDTSACNDNTQYVIDLQTYLYVAGGVQLGMSAIYFFTQIVAFLCFSENTWMNIKFCMSRGICHCISSCYPLWHLLWACIGIYIYAAEMSSQCQKTDVGTMILAWCVIEFVGVCCISCCVVCFAMALKAAR